jgi:4-hydroxybenzoate polyprenyltransferase
LVATPSRAHRLYPPRERVAGQSVQLIEPTRATLTTWIKALRVHQWSKNLLVLLPVLAGQRLGDSMLVLQAGLAAISASCLASAVYLANDLLDVHADRGSASSRVRPIADGSIPYGQAVGTAIGLALLAFVIGVGLQGATATPVVGLLVAYALANVLYSTGLKRVMMLDIMLLSTMYLWRIVLGSVVTGIVLSDWLLAFSVFFFLGLASAKRCIELAAYGAPPTPGESARSGRGYVSTDLPVLRVIGIGSALVSVLVLALYLKDAQTAALYSRPQWLWGVVLLELYWVTRLWLLVSRGHVSSDPVDFATRDRPTYLVAVLALLALVLAR